MRKISEEYKRLPEQDKAKMQQMYKKEMETYAIRLDKVPKEVMDKTKADKKSKLLLKAGGKKKADAELKILLESLNKPKRPGNAYFQFCMDMRPHLPTGMKATEQSKQLSKEWKQASKATKEKYEKYYSELVIKYEKELEKWSTKMHNQGKTEEIATVQKRLVQARKSAKENA